MFSVRIGLLSGCFWVNLAARTESVGASRCDVRTPQRSVPNYEGFTPLHESIMDGSKGIVQLLIASNAEVNAKDNQGETPLYLAVNDGHKDVVELLLDNKANVNAKDKYGTTPLHLAANLARFPSDELNTQTYQGIVELLKQYGATNN